MISFSLKGQGSTTIARRLFVAAAGLGPLFVAFYRAPAWLESWSMALFVGAIGIAAGVLVLAIGVAVRGSASIVKRVALEISAFACALLAAEAALLARAPESWPDDPIVQRIAERKRAAEQHGIEYDGRLRVDIVRELQSSGVDAVPGFVQIGTAPKISAAIRARGLLPLSNVSNVTVVECNEGAGYMKYRSDELGFNNPRGIVSGPVDIAVVGESMALGHCVPPSKSAVDLIRARFPRTANFGVAGSRVLTQVALFREYAEPLRPPVVVWFVNPGFALAQEENDQPILVKYLNDPEFSQDLRHRQDEIDAFVREVMLPANLARDERVRNALAQAGSFPFERLIKLRDVRGLIDVPEAMRQPVPDSDFSDFERAVHLIVDSTQEWGGAVIVAILPSFETSNEVPGSLARYEAVLDVLDGSHVTVVDGVDLFAGQPDISGLYNLGIDNHPSERGHALLADAIIAAIEHEAPHEPQRNNTSH